MKKFSLVALLAFITVPLVSCGLGSDEEQLDPNEIVSLKVKGSLNKTHYALDDEWDYSGLSVYSVTRGGTQTKLKSSEYTLTNKVPSPEHFISTLSLTFKYKKNNKIFVTYNPKNISVDSPTYDEEAEKETYYADLDIGTKKGEALRAELQRHSFAKHSKFVTYNTVASYKIRSYDSANNCYIESTDLIPNESRLEAMYTGKEANYSFGTKEHIWACNDSAGLWEHKDSSQDSHNVDLPSYIGGGSDLYHIRPVDSDVNTARGDAPFVDFDDSEFSSKKSSSVLVGDGGPYKLRIYGAGKDGDKYMYARLVEVDDQMKGDIARIVAYVYMHYKTVSGYTPSTASFRDMVGNLDITQVLGFSTSSKAFRKLVEWNNLDPVSEVEKYRNHTVMGIQGNRNPFVDYPNLVTEVFGN